MVFLNKKLQSFIQAARGMVVQVSRAVWRFVGLAYSAHPTQPMRRACVIAFVGVVSVLVLLATVSIMFPLRVDIPYSQIILADDGTVIHAFLSADDKWRMKTELSEISPTLREAIIHKEDRWFYWHVGINPVAAVRAAVNNATKRTVTSGASTITMQVARMLENRRAASNGHPFKHPSERSSERGSVRERTLWNKIVEMLRALQLEARFSKDEILQLYLNLAPFGGNIEGVKSASILYFGQSPERLSLAQAVAFTIIPNRPTTLSLKSVDKATSATHHSNTGVHATHSTHPPHSLKSERNKWLRRFAAEGVFAAREVDDALHEPLDITRRDAPSQAPHFALRLRGLFPDEPIIRSTLNPAKQAHVQTISANKMRRLAMRGIYNAAAIVIDNRSRAVVAYLGSPDFIDKAHFGEVDGVRSVRSPGSALKPLIYGLAIDRGLITPKTVLTDVPVNFNGYAPENFDRRCTGAVTAEKALVMSLNVPAVKLLDAVGVPAMVESLKRAGFEQIRNDEKKLGLSLVLGGCGVRLEEMVGLYAALANYGSWSPLVFCGAEQSALKRNVFGQNIFPQNNFGQNSDALQSAQLLSPAAAFMLSEILTQLTRPDVPNRFLGATKLPKIAWKTGTSYGRRDAWACGFNRRYTIAVWVGNFSGAGTPELVGADIATPLLFELFNAIDYNSPNDWFAPPVDVMRTSSTGSAKGLDFRLVCAESGLPPSDFCADQITDYYIPSISPTKRCEHLKRVFVSLDEATSYCADCLPLAGQYKVKLYPNLAPELVALYTNEQYDFERIPEHDPSCKRVQASIGTAPTIHSLVDGKEYLVERDATGKVISQLLLACTAANNVRLVHWFVNDRFVRTVAPHERVFFVPERGEVKISCSDDHGRTAHIKIFVGLQ